MRVACTLICLTALLVGAPSASAVTPPGSSLQLSPDEVTIQAGAARAWSPTVTATVTLPGYSGSVFWAWGGGGAGLNFFSDSYPTTVTGTGTAALTFSSFAGTTTPGTFTRTVTAFNPSTNVSVSAPLTVHVVPDTIAPSFTVPDDITVDATGPTGAVVTFTAPTRATDNVGGQDFGGYVDVTCDGRSGDTFPVGATVVTCSATDAAGNETRHAFTITVNGIADTTAPTVSCAPGPNPDGDTTPAETAGFRRLVTTDDVGVARLVVEDTGSAFVSSPFASGDVVHVRSTPGAVPGESRPGPGGVAARLRLRGQARLVAVDAAGNRGVAVCPAVPPGR